MQPARTRVRRIAGADPDWEVAAMEMMGWCGWGETTGPESPGMGTCAAGLGEEGNGGERLMRMMIEQGAIRVLEGVASTAGGADALIQAGFPSCREWTALQVPVVCGVVCNMALFCRPSQLRILVAWAESAFAVAPGNALLAARSILRGLRYSEVGDIWRRWMEETLLWMGRGVSGGEWGRVEGLRFLRAGLRAMSPSWHEPLGNAWGGLDRAEDEADWGDTVEVLAWVGLGRAAVSWPGVVGKWVVIAGGRWPFPQILRSGSYRVRAAGRALLDELALVG